MSEGPVRTRGRSRLPPRRSRRPDKEGRGRFGYRGGRHRRSGWNTCASRRCGACSSTAPSSRACRLLSRTRCPSARAIRASTCRPALAMLGPEWGPQGADRHLRRAGAGRPSAAALSVMALSFVAQSARGAGKPQIPQADVDKANSIPERFPHPLGGGEGRSPTTPRRIDAYWIFRRRARHERPPTFTAASMRLHRC